MHCHPLSVSVAVVLTLVFTIGLKETATTNWTHSERFLLTLFYLFWAGCIITVYCTDEVSLHGPGAFLL
jgi:hypothetical protein